MNLISPTLVALLALLLAALLAIAGVYLLAGLGWSLIGAAACLALLAGLIYRGLHRAQQIAE